MVARSVVCIRSIFAQENAIFWVCCTAPISNNHVCWFASLPICVPDIVAVNKGRKSLVWIRSRQTNPDAMESVARPTHLFGLQFCNKIVFNIGHD